MSAIKDRTITYNDVPQQSADIDYSFPADYMRRRHTAKPQSYRDAVEPVYAERFAKINELRRALGLDALTKSECHIAPFYFISEADNELIMSDSKLADGMKIKTYKNKSEKAPVPVYSFTSTIIVEIMGL